MSKRPALGRGLASLIPEAVAPSEEAKHGAIESRDHIHQISVDLLDAGKYQPRTEFDDDALEDLCRSIQEKGILQPLLARRTGDRYELIAGERRLRAAKAAGLLEVPVLLREATDLETLELALIENIQRDDLNAIELARAFKQLQEEFGYTQEEVSRRVGKDRSTVTNHLRLLKLPDSVKAALADNRISMGHARTLLGLEDEALQEKAMALILEREMSVRETEQLVKRLRQAPKSPKPAPPPSTEVGHVTERLKRTFQTQVQILPRKQGAGEIRIEYYSSDDLNRILELIPEP